MSSTEIELAVEIGTGLLPGGKLSAKVRRTWQQRSDNFKDQLLAETKMSLESIEDACLEDERLADIFLRSAERVMRVGDVFYREALGAAVSAAFSEDASIDDCEELIDQLLVLDATCLRVLANAYEPNASVRFSDLEAMLHRRGWEGRTLASALARLVAGGFIEKRWDVQTELPEREREFAQSDATAMFEKTDWGRWAYEICLAHLNPRR